MIFYWLITITVIYTDNAAGQFIRVGIHKEEQVSPSYGNSRNSGPRRTTTVPPAVYYWPVPRQHRDNGQSAQGGQLIRLRQSRHSYTQWLTELNSNNYDKYLLPKVEEDQPVEVNVSMMIIRVHSLSDASMDYGIEMYYSEQWNDYRLRFTPLDYEGVDELNLPVAAVNHVWRPDTYFFNAISAEVDSESSVTHKAYFRLHHNGDVHYSRKISLKADCPMDLTMYPFDMQSCKLKLGSYSNPSRDVEYKWVQKKGQDLAFTERIDLAEFVAEKWKTKRHKINYTTGSFDSLELCLTFKRRAGFCIMQVFFPATAVVMSSWVALWLAEDTTFSDVLAVILAIIFLAYAYNSVMPRVSYVKLLDLYMCSCFLFVFLSLAKLVIIKYFCHKWAKESNRSSDFILDQLFGVNATRGDFDIEKQIFDSDSGSNSRRSSSSCSGGGGGGVPKEEKKRPKQARKKKLRNGSVKNATENGKGKHDDEDFHSALAPIAESEENCKNEKIEASLAIENEETKPHVQPPASHGLISVLNPLAALFGGGAGAQNAANGGGGRRIAFLGMEAFAAWFSHQEKRKKSDLARYMRYLRCFHVVTQLALPLAFGAFFVFLLLIYPNVPRSDEC